MNTNNQTKSTSAAIPVTKREAITMALKVRNVHVEKKELQLTEREIECLSEIIVFGIENDGKEKLSPFTGIGRAKVCEAISITSSQYTRVLGKLVNIGLIISLGKRGNYMITPYIYRFFNFEKLKKGGIITLCTQYNIIPDKKESNA